MATLGREGEVEEPRVWALTRLGFVCQWLLIAGIVGALAVAGWHMVVRGPSDSVPFVAAAGSVVLVMLLRGVVAVWIDPADGTVVLFRAAGGSVRTTLERVRRLDYGLLNSTYRLQQRERCPIRIVTDDGTATLSWLFPHPVEVVEDLAELCPRVHFDL